MNEGKRLLTVQERLSKTKQKIAQELFDELFEHSTAYSASNPWKIMVITYSKEAWRALKEKYGVK